MTKCAESFTCEADPGLFIAGVKQMIKWKEGCWLSGTMLDTQHKQILLVQDRYKVRLRNFNHELAGIGSHAILIS